MGLKKLKITVLKTLNGKDIYGENLPVTPNYPLVCDVFNEGDEFIIDDTGEKPEGFCQWAWDDLTRMILILQYDGNSPFIEEDGTFLGCCTDAVRPVIFKLERLES